VPNDRDPPILGAVDGAEITRYRLDQLQLSIQALNVQVAAVSTQISGLYNIYLTRIEFAETLRQKEMQQDVIDKRLDANDDKQIRQDTALKSLEDSLAARGWALAMALLAATVGLIIGAVNLATHIPLGR
jgi:hypothetical protein